METARDWEHRCQQQQDEIRLLKQQISRLEQRLHGSNENAVANGQDTTSDDSGLESFSTRREHEHQLLERASALVARQKTDLKAQAQKLKHEKETWRLEHARGRSAAVVSEMKRVLDTSVQSLNRNMRQLRATEDRILAQRRQIHDLPTSSELSNEGSSVSSVLSSLADSQSSCHDDIGSESSECESEAPSLLDELHRLHNDLARDESPSFSPVHDDWQSPPMAETRHLHDPYVGLVDPLHRRPPRAMRPFAPTDRRQMNEQWQCASIYDKQITSWAIGRHKVQVAAQQHATWLNSLCQELEAYSTVRSQPRRAMLEEL
ncbi:hypothetical protein SDRG_00689 [Saprolegnia diclina VS20]|uniref:Uncharacterized protein n=1 Tax=Saprolegnia diclina (strain VS20) TaxID=1156394 RepID=T0R5X2_SAPDV|nr:hypothetical protein SDRG_00689 [Saprolegnia diclina VS20]EQC41830.1 hypothetical protein SDRG_00689 [Saprolegnia diclina VS20]|eukprot:XP_008604399.1 hypothetical protein SDRG_00689 [Saprolegnia diclina VS20]